MVDDVNQLATEGDRQVYVLSNTSTLNYSILKGSGLPYTTNNVPNLTSYSVIDIRDGFPLSFLTSDIIIVADPVESSQLVIKFFAEEILNSDSELGQFYELYGEYKLDNGITAKIFIKTKPLSLECVEYMRNYFSANFAEYPDLFSDRIDAYIAEYKPS